MCMNERSFVDSLVKTIKERHKGIAIRASDNYTMGIPDILAWIPVNDSADSGSLVWSLGIEAKALVTLMENPFEKGRRIGNLLKHPFSGPQISMLRSLKRCGVDAFGIVRVSRYTAFRIGPEEIPARTGNFTHDELMEVGCPVYYVNGDWQFWKENDKVPGSRHRNCS